MDSPIFIVVRFSLSFAKVVGVPLLFYFFAHFIWDSPRGFSLGQASILHGHLLITPQNPSILLFFGCSSFMLLCLLVIELRVSSMNMVARVEDSLRWGYMCIKIVSMRLR